MAELVRNRRVVADLTGSDVDAALAALEAADSEVGDAAAHVYETLTWGEGPGQLCQARLQDWLWYRLPTKYMTDEDGYMGRYAAAAAELFDALGLDGYAAICRSAVTAGVHAAFERSETDGFAAMRKAMNTSGIEPPPLDDFTFGQIMGTEEACALSAVEDALEAAIAAGDLDVGGRGWRNRQKEIVAAVLDSDHPSQPNQSWRTAVLTERIGTWVSVVGMRPGPLGALRSRVAKRLLHPVEAPSDVTERMRPVTWLLETFGDRQTLTDAGYLNRAFVTAVHKDRPWQDRFSYRPPRSEVDDLTLHCLRSFCQDAGALRKHGRELVRTKIGAAMATDPAVAWKTFTEKLGTNPWDRFVAQTAGLILLDLAAPTPESELVTTVQETAEAAGWRSGSSGTSPSEREVSRAFNESRFLLELFGMIEEDGAGQDRCCQLTPAGEATFLAAIRADAAGPRSSPWS